MTLPPLLPQTRPPRSEWPARILAALPGTASEVAYRLGVRPDDVSRRLLRLYTQGRVTRDSLHRGDPWRYEVRE